MLKLAKDILATLTTLQNNPPALVAVVALASLSVAALALYVVLQVVRT